MANPRDSGEIGRLQNVGWLVSFHLLHPIWSKSKHRCQFLTPFKSKCCFNPKMSPLTRTECCVEFPERSLGRGTSHKLIRSLPIEQPRQWFYLHSASFVWPVVPLHQLWWFKEGTRTVRQQLHRNMTFWVWVTTARPDYFYGRSKVVRRSQPCVKGALWPRGDPW